MCYKIFNIGNPLVYDRFLSVTVNIEYKVDTKIHTNKLEINKESESKILTYFFYLSLTYSVHLIS